MRITTICAMALLAGSVGGPASARVTPFISGTGILRVAKGPVGFQIIFR